MTLAEMHEVLKVVVTAANQAKTYDQFVVELNKMFDDVHSRLIDYAAIRRQLREPPPPPPTEKF